MKNSLILSKSWFWIISHYKSYTRWRCLFWMFLKVHLNFCLNKMVLLKIIIKRKSKQRSVSTTARKHKKPLPSPRNKLYLNGMPFCAPVVVWLVKPVADWALTLNSMLWRSACLNLEKVIIVENFLSTSHWTTDPTRTILQRSHLPQMTKKLRWCARPDAATWHTRRVIWL